jgi:SAM-dependent methyltransferase
MAAVGETNGGTPKDTAAASWQLKMFSKTLKKQQKLRLLLDQIGDVRGKKCLLVTNGDNNGALNHHFRGHGGEWSWVENEEDHIAEMAGLLGEPVVLGSGSHIPAEDGSFDVIVSIDVHEHLADFAPFNRELLRVVRPGGTVVITTPNGDAWKPVTVLKGLCGMSARAYGHYVIGYNLAQQDQMLREVGFEPVARGSYSGFFTELIEFAINFAYVKILSKRGGQDVKEGTIAPTNEAQLESVERQYRLYSAIYPILLTLSKLDRLLFFFTGYAVSTVARRPT